MTSADDLPPEYGIRVSLPPGEPFANLVGEDWEKTHWFTTPAARDRAFSEMQREHEYSRRGDKPTLIFEPIGQGQGGK
jgi:hypothetical protein